MVISDKNLVSYLPLVSCSQVRWLWSRVLPQADNTNETSLMGIGRGFFGNVALISSVISNCAGREGFAQILCKRLLVFSLKAFNHTNVSLSTTQGPEIRELPRDYLEPVHSSMTWNDN